MMALLITAQLAAFHAGLMKDCLVLEKAFEEMHPGLYRYSTPAKWRQSLLVLRSQWAKATNLREAYVDLSQFTAKIRCGHTYPNFFNQKRSVVEEVFHGDNRVPFYFRWLGDKMVVLKDFTPNKTLPPGTEIVKIDGIPCRDILAKLMTIARADGSNDYKRRAYLSVTGDDTFEAFDIYLPLMFPIPDRRFSLVTKDLTGYMRQVKVAAVSSTDRADAYRKASVVAPGQDRWSLKIHDDLAILKMPSWEMYDGKWDWEGYLKKTFAKLKAEHVRNLAIDLRGDEGGSSIGDVLAGYLTSKPIHIDNYHEYTRYAKIDPSIKPDADTWDRSFDDLSQWVGKPRTISTGHNVFYPMTRYEGKACETILPEKDRFVGKVFVFVDNSNSSATFEFDNLVQTYHLGTLVGEPTGGNLRGINGGAFYFLRLPNSHLEVDLPLIAQFPTLPKPDRGLKPDVLVVPTRSDIAKGRDVNLERVRTLIGRP